MSQDVCHVRTRSCADGRSKMKYHERKTVTVIANKRCAARLRRPFSRPIAAMQWRGEYGWLAKQVYGSEMSRATSCEGLGCESVDWQPERCQS